MAKIKHIALSTQDPEATAKFYVDVFGMKQVGRIDNPNTSGYYLTDGDLNLAILKFKNDAVAGVERGKDWSGIHHFGFQVDSLEDITERRYGNVEVKYTGPDGVTVDVSESGWVGTPSFAPKAED